MDNWGVWIVSYGYGRSYGYVGRLPLGVAILAVLIGIVGFFVIIGGVLLLVFGTSLAFGSGSLTVFGSAGTVTGLILLIVGIVTVAVAAGLWNQELWALVLAILVVAFYALIDFASGAWFGFIIAAVLLVYLLAVSGHFD